VVYREFESRSDQTEDPKNEDLHSIGTLATILQMLKLPDGTIKVLVEGVKRAKIEEFFQADDYTEVKVSEFVLESGQDTEIKAMMRLALESFESYIKLNKKIPEEVLGILKEVSDVERFSDIIIANLSHTLIVPSGNLSICKIVAKVPILCKSSFFGSSVFSSFCATKNIYLFVPIA
jgi:ATP-dependent Lon protease